MELLSTICSLYVRGYKSFARTDYLYDSSCLHNRSFSEKLGRQEVVTRNHCVPINYPRPTLIRILRNILIQYCPHPSSPLLQTSGAYAYTKTDAVEAKLTAGVKDGIKASYGKDDKASKGLTVAIDWFQENVKCCGARFVNKVHSFISFPDGT